MNNTGNDIWSTIDNPFEYIQTTASGAAQFNDDVPLKAKFLWDNMPSTITTGDSIIVTLLVRNDGNEKWSAMNNFKLGQNENLDPTLFGAGRYLLNDSLDDIPLFGGIFRGRVKEFTIKLIAPETLGTYLTHWQMIQEENNWFGDILEKEITVIPPTSTENIENTNLNIFPNPANTFLYLDKVKGNEIIIYNIIGKLMKRIKVNPNQSNVSISISEFSSGIYFIKTGNLTREVRDRITSPYIE